MPYSPTDWVDGVTPVDAAHMDKMEAGILAAEEKAAKEVAGGYAGLDGSARLADARLPTRLSPLGKPLPSQDFDLATENGFFFADSAAHSPDGAAPYFAVLVIVGANNPAYVRQFAWDVYGAGAGREFTRQAAGGVFTAWVKTTNADGSAANMPNLSATYQARSEKAAASGYASLDAGTKVPAAQIPDLSATYQALSAKAAANGYASLDSGGKVPAAQLPAASSSVPPRLDTVCQTITDWNTAKDNGFYMGSGAANAPIAGVWFYGEVIQHNPSWVTQEVWQFAGNYSHWIRHLESGTWAPWRRQFASQASGKFYTGSMSNDTSYPFAVTFPVPFRAVPMVVASVSYFTLDWANVRVACTDNTTTGFTLYIHNVAGGNAVEVNWIAVEQ